MWTSGAHHSDYCFCFVRSDPDAAKHAGIEGDATFVGGGPTFQIWEAGRFKRHQEEMRARIRERGLTLPPMAPK